MADDKKTNKPSSDSQEKPKDAVDEVLDELELKELSHEQVIQQLDSLKGEIVKGTLQVSEEKLLQLKEKTREEFARHAEQQLLALNLDTLEKKLLEIEKLATQPVVKPVPEPTPDRTSKVAQVMETVGGVMEKGVGKMKEGMKVAKEAFEKSWEKTKGGVMAMGEFFGVTFPEKAGEAWHFIVKHFWKIMASPVRYGMKESFFTGIAVAKVNQMDMWEGMRDFAEDSKLISLQVTQENCVEKYKQLLPIFRPFPGDNMREKASKYLSEYLRQKHPKTTKDNKMFIDIERLIDPMNQVLLPLSLPTQAPAAPQVTAAPNAAPATAPVQPTPVPAQPNAAPNNSSTSSIPNPT